MPFFDRRCPSCETVTTDCMEPSDAPTVLCEKCNAPTERVWLMGRANNIIGDEIDITIRNGLCNPDGSPRRYTSRTELRREEVRRGMTNHVVHQPGKGGDKSKHTVRWI